MSSYPQPGAPTGQQQQPTSIFSSSMPIKKRRFPILRPSSPEEENITSTQNIESKDEQESKISEINESKNQQESKIQDEEMPSLIDERNAYSRGNFDFSKASASTVKEDVGPSTTDLGQPNVENLASKANVAKPIVNMISGADLGNKFDILSNEKSPDPEVPEICMRSQAANAKKEKFNVQKAEGSCGLELSMGTMSVELSLGWKEPAVASLEYEEDEVICIKPDTSDPSLLSLASRDKKLARLGRIDSSLNEVASQVCTNRSNWDLNTTMDVWEGSMGTDAFTDTLADVGGFGKTDNFQGEKLSLATAETIGLNLDKGENILDVGESNSSNAAIQQSSQRCKTDYSLGLRLSMPHIELDVRKEHFPLPDYSVSTSASRSLGLQQVQISDAIVNRPVKSEPVDENNKCDCSIGSNSSSNGAQLLKSYVKTEFVNNHRMVTVPQPSVSMNKFIHSGKSMPSEAVHLDNQKASKSDDITPHQSISRIMQHQGSCASSSFPLTKGSLTPQSLCSLSLPACSESMRELPYSCSDDKISRPDDIGNLGAVNNEQHKLAPVDEDTFELDKKEKLNKPARMTEEWRIKSGSGSQWNCDVGNSTDRGENKCIKEDEEYEDGEVREPIQCPDAEKQIGVEKEMETFEYNGCAYQNLQPTDDQDVIRPSNFGSKDSAKEILEETHNDSNDDRIGPYSESNSLQKALAELVEVGIDEKKTISVTPGELLEDCLLKEISIDGPADMDCGAGVEVEDADNDELVKETCSGDENNNSTLSKAEASLDGHDASKDFSSAENKNRIINLSRASAVTSPCKTRSIPKRLLTTRSGKERYSDLDGEEQLRGNRDELYTSSRTNKFAKHRAEDQDQPHRNPRASFSNRRGRISGRFGSLHGDWDPPDHDFASETPYGPSDYLPSRRKHVSGVEIKCNSYDIQRDITSDRRQPNNEEFSPFRHMSLRRLSPDRHNDKFLRHLSDDIINPSYNNPQAMYTELDGQQLVRGNRNFSNMQRKSRTGSPGPWSSPQNNRRSPSFYRTRRMRSPDRPCFYDEMVPRRRGRRGSPSYSPRHHPNNDPRSGNSNRRGSTERRGQRKDGLDSGEIMGDCDEYMDEPSNKFNERHGHVRSFQPSYNGDGENFRFHLNEGHRPYRFCSDLDGEFVERGSDRMREREFGGRVKHHHQSMGLSRRIRNADEHDDGSYRPVEVKQIWHGDGFSDDRGKRRRF